MFDIIGSLMVRTAIVLIVLRMNVSLNNMMTETVAHSAIQGGLSVLRDVMARDFEPAGLGVASGTAFLTATTSEIKYKAILDSTGTVHTVRYYAGSTDELSSTPNPFDRKLYRQIDSGTPLNVANGIRKCEFTYYDQYGAATTTPSQIKMFSIKITIEDGTAIDGKYPSTFWEQSFFPPNL